MNIRLLLAALITAMALVALAQEAAGPVTISVAQSEEFGPYLVDSEGRTLYLFVNEEMRAQDPERLTEGVRVSAAPCSGGCLEAWPPLTATEVQAGEGVNPELLYTADVNGMMMVVYNGWPLYYFMNDTEAGQINGQGRGGAPNIWYIVSPEGQAIEEEAGGGGG